MKQRRIVFVAMFSAMVFGAFVVVEVALGIFGYGTEARLFERHRYVNGSYVENNTFYNRYFDKGHWSHVAKSMPIRNVFRYRKGAGVLRGFLLGESAAQGFPYNSNQAFGKMIEAALASTGRYEKVELVNAAASAISSYAMRDIARRLDEYEPDFLIIYAGNNEYYGTISESTGGSHASRTLYLELRNLKVLELAFDAASGQLFRPVGGGEELMAARFADKRFPANVTVDDRVARNFVANVDAIVSQYADRIPVILAEPVANLIDMPPFAGEDDARYAAVIEPYANALHSKDVEKARGVHDKSRVLLGPTHNATLHYLDGLYAALVDPNGPVEEELATARDLDLAPFRPRSAELKALRNYALEKSKTLPKLHFVPLHDVLASRAEPDIFGRRMFVDHVHFNQAGHRMVAEILAKTTSEALGFDDAQKAKVQQFFSDPRTPTDAVHCLPFYRLFANYQIGDLSKMPPYSTMPVKFQLDKTEVDEALKEIGPELASLIYDKTQDPAFSAVVNFYMTHDEFKKAHEMLIAENFAYPGQYTSHRNLARFCAKFTDLIDQAEAHYRLAYLFSGKDPEVHKEMVEFLAQNNRKEALLQ